MPPPGARHQRGGLELHLEPELGNLQRSRKLCRQQYEDDPALRLPPLEKSPPGESDRDGWLQSLAQRSIDDEQLVVEVSRSGVARTALCAPLWILDRITGAIERLTMIRAFSCRAVAA